MPESEVLSFCFISAVVVNFVFLNAAAFTGMLINAAKNITAERTAVNSAVIIQRFFFIGNTKADDDSKGTKQKKIILFILNVYISYIFYKGYFCTV